MEYETNKEFVSGGDWATSMAKRKIYALAQVQTKLRKLKKGVFFTPKAGDKVNSMVIE